MLSPMAKAIAGRRRMKPRSGYLRASLPLVGMLMMRTLVSFKRAYPDISLDLDRSNRAAIPDSVMPPSAVWSGDDHVRW